LAVIATTVTETGAKCIVTATMTEAVCVSKCVGLETTTAAGVIIVLRTWS
jgi:hypothetical protein